MRETLEQNLHKIDVGHRLATHLIVCFIIFISFNENKNPNKID